MLEKKANLSFNKENLEKIILQADFKDFKWIKSENIYIAQWVRVKCLFGCDGYGGATCPPNVPSVEECQQFINEYEEIVIIHFEKEVDKNNYPKEWSIENTKRLVELEKEIFLAGFHKAFLLNQCTCNLCKDCVPNKVDCKIKLSCRPTPEAFSIDVYKTARSIGYPINVLTDKSKKMDRYAFLMIE